MANNRITLKQFYDEFIPFVETMSEIKTDLGNINKKLTGYCTDNKSDHKDMNKDIKSKISTKAFAGWLGSLSVIVSIILVLIGLIK